MKIFLSQLRRRVIIYLIIILSVYFSNSLATAVKSTTGEELNEKDFNKVINHVYKKEYDQAKAECNKILILHKDNSETNRWYRIYTKWILIGILLEEKNVTQMEDLSKDMKNEINDKPNPIVDGFPVGWQYQFGIEQMLAGVYFRSGKKSQYLQQVDNAEQILKKQKSELMNNKEKYKKLNIKVDDYVSWIDTQYELIDDDMKNEVKKEIENKNH